MKTYRITGRYPSGLLFKGSYKATSSNAAVAKLAQDEPLVTVEKVEDAQTAPNYI